LVSDPTQTERLTAAPWNFWVVVVAATVGNTVGSLIGYAIGAWGGRPFLERYGRYLLIRPHELELAEHFFERYGSATAFFSRLLPIVRTFISFPAGVAQMPLPRFIAYSTAGAFFWSAALVYAGVLLGARWQEIRPGRARDTGYSCCRRPLVRVDDRDRVGLAGRYVHLADAEASQQYQDREGQIRHERHEEQQHIRRQVREHHRVDEPDPGRQPGRRQRRNRGKNIGTEEDRSEQGGIGAEADV